jgi:hypothetical protein
MKDDAKPNVVYLCRIPPSWPHWMKSPPVKLNDGYVVVGTSTDHKQVWEDKKQRAMAQRVAVPIKPWFIRYCVQIQVHEPTFFQCHQYRIDMDCYRTTYNKNHDHVFHKNDSDFLRRMIIVGIYQDNQQQNVVLSKQQQHKLQVTIQEWEDDEYDDAQLTQNCYGKKYPIS